MFPFTIKYKKTLSSNFDLIENETILKCFQENLKRNGINRIFIEDNSILKYKNDFFAIRSGLNWNIWVGISGGRIEFIETQNKRIVIYIFDTSRFFIIGLITGVVFVLFSKMILAGLFAFSVLGLLNWVISISRHRLNFSDLLNEVLKDKNNGLQPGRRSRSL